MDVHEAFVPNDREQRFADIILKAAKAFTESGSFEPTAILIEDSPEDSLAFLPLGGFGDWNKGGDRQLISLILRRLVQRVKPACFGLVSDSWFTSIGDPAGAASAGLDPREVRDWSDDGKKRFRVVRREALFVSVETKDRQFMLIQFYRRDFKDRPIWEETELSSGCHEGRFSGMMREETQ